MEDYKVKLYERYYSTHNTNLYGTSSIEKIKNNYTVWNYFFKRHLPENFDANILDMGCGDGAFVYYLQQTGYRLAEGMDYSQEQIDCGIKLGINNLQRGDAIECLKNGENKYDLIIARDVFEHFTKQDIYDLLKLTYQALRPGGKLIIQVPNGEGLHAASILYGDFTHEVAFTESSIHQLFLNTGYKKVNCFPTGPVPKNAVGVIRKVLWGIRVLAAKFWRIVETGTSGRIYTSNLIAVGEK